MITRRGFIIAGGSTLGALGLASASSAMAALEGDGLTIASQSRQVAPADQASRHIALTGQRMEDLNTLQRIFRAAEHAQITLHIDTADLVLLDIALSRITTPYKAVAAAPGALSYRRSSAFGV